MEDLITKILKDVAADMVAEDVKNFDEAVTDAR